MRHVDFSPLYRSTVGFDRLFTMLDSLGQPDQAQTYPPYNIEVTGEDRYALTLAVAGFGPDDIELVAKDDTLTVTGKLPAQPEGEERKFLHRGIAGRAFERRFVLADHIVVTGADLANGLLHVALKHVVPEALKPRRIPVQTGRPAIEAQAA